MCYNCVLLCLHHRMLCRLLLRSCANSTHGQNVGVWAHKARLVPASSAVQGAAPSPHRLPDRVGTKTGFSQKGHKPLTGGQMLLSVRTIRHTLPHAATCFHALPTFFPWKSIRGNRGTSATTPLVPNPSGSCLTSTIPFAVPLLRGSEACLQSTAISVLKTSVLKISIRVPSLDIEQ